MITVETNLDELLKSLNKLKDQLNNFIPLWGFLHLGLQDWFATTFETDGFGSWPDTSRPNPILRDTLRYYHSFVRTTPDTVDVRSSHDWFYGSSVEYGHYHEQGLGQEIRQVPGELAQSDEFDKWLEEAADEWLRVGPISISDL